MKLIYQVILCITACISLCACGSMQKTSHTLYINIHAVKYLNPSLNNKPQPLLISLFQLKQSFTFMSESFYSLMGKNSVLAKDLLDMTRIEIRPGEQKQLQINLQNNTQYIGIIANFNQINTAQWRKLIVITPDKKTNQMSLALESHSINVNTSHSFWRAL